MLIAVSQRRCPVSVDTAVNTVPIVVLLVVPIGIVVQPVAVLLL